MDRYVLLIKAPKDFDAEPLKEELIELISSKYPNLKVEMYKCIALTVDLVILYNNGVVLIKRGNEPYKDCWALPGGFVEYGERVEDAAIREGKEETGLNIELIKLIGVYSDPNRDPRGHTVTAAFLAKGEGKLRGGDDAREAKVFKFEELKHIRLAFDHEKIIEDALKIMKELQERGEL